MDVKEHIIVAYCYMYSTNRVYGCYGAHYYRFLLHVQHEQNLQMLRITLFSVKAPGILNLNTGWR
jgi:hypothetical protein